MERGEKNGEKNGEKKLVVFKKVKELIESGAKLKMIGKSNYMVYEMEGSDYSVTEEVFDHLPFNREIIVEVNPEKGEPDYFFEIDGKKVGVCDWMVKEVKE